jgi:integrase
MGIDDITCKLLSKGGKMMANFFQDENGTWRCNYEKRRRDGTFFPTSKRGFPTKKEAKAWHAKYAQKLSEGIDIDGENKTLSVWMDEWLDTYCAKKEDNTYASYKNNSSHIKKALGGYKLCELNQKMVQDFYNAFTEPDEKGKSLSQTMLQRVHTTFNQAMRKAEQLGYVNINPCEGTDRGEPEEKELLYCTAEQLQTFINLAKKSEYYMPLLVCALLGIRRGEALGILWNAIDGDQIKIQAQYVPNNRKGGAIHKDKLKTKKSKRTLDVPPALTLELKKQKKRQLADKLECGEKYIDSDYVCTAKGGGPMSPSETTHEAKRIMSAAGIDPRIHLHDLRHSFATLLRQAGVSIEDISAALGHSEVRTTHNFYVASDRKAAGNTTCIISGLVGMEPKK